MERNKKVCISLERYPSGPQFGFYFSNEKHLICTFNQRMGILFRFHIKYATLSGLQERAVAERHPSEKHGGYPSVT
jgi:hypothetical protein